MCHAPSAISVLIYVHIPLILRHAYTQWKTHVHTCKPLKAHVCRQKYIHTLNIYRHACTYWHIYIYTQAHKLTCHTQLTHTQTQHQHMYTQMYTHSQHIHRHANMFTPFSGYSITTSNSLLAQFLYSKSIS